MASDVQSGRSRLSIPYAGMDARSIDPRDISTEFEPFSYRVVFWSSDKTSREYEITGARDVVEVIEWANKTDGETPYALYVVIATDPNGFSTIHLLGVDPTTTP